MRFLILAAIAGLAVLPASQACIFTVSLGPFQVLDTATGTLTTLVDAELRSGGLCGSDMPLQDMHGDLLAWMGWHSGPQLINITTGQKLSMPARESSGDTESLIVDNPVVAGPSGSRRGALSLAGTTVYSLSRPGVGVSRFDFGSGEQSIVAWPFPDSTNGTASLGGSVLYWFPWHADGWYSRVWAYDLEDGRMILSGPTIQQLGAPSSVRELSWLAGPSTRIGALGGAREGILFFERSDSIDPAAGKPVARHWFYRLSDGSMTPLSTPSGTNATTPSFGLKGSDAGSGLYLWGSDYPLSWLDLGRLDTKPQPVQLPPAIEHEEHLIFGAASDTRILFTQVAQRLPSDEASEGLKPPPEVIPPPPQPAPSVGAAHALMAMVVLMAVRIGSRVSR